MAKNKPAPSTTATASARQAAKPAGLGPRGGKPAFQDRPLKVRATQTGYYDHKRRRLGDVFTIANEKAFSGKWMELANPAAKEHTTSAPQALRQAHDEILGGKVTKAEDATGDADVM